eukprot:Gb_02475 [translate_table: standard]
MNMKGSKEGKGRKGSGTALDSEPLFPRLHVNEGDKTGPRAPPRNKMALYEQLTFPSHRFVPPALPHPGTITNTISPSSGNQGSGYEGRYSFSPFCLAAAVAYPDANMGCQDHKQLSASVSIDSAVIDVDRKTQRGLGIVSNGRTWMPSPAAESYTYASYASINKNNPAGKKIHNEDDFRVPQYSNLRKSPKSMREPHGSHKCQQTDSCHSNPARTSGFASDNYEHEAAVPCSSWIDSQEGCAQSVEIELQRAEDNTREHMTECANIQAGSNMQFQAKNHLKQSIYLSDSDNTSYDYNGCLQWPQNSSHVTDVVKLGEHTVTGECVIGKGDNMNSIKQTCMDLNVTSEGLVLSDGNSDREELPKPVDFDVKGGKIGDGSRQRNNHIHISSSRNNYESTGESDNFSNGTAVDLSVPSQPMQGVGREDDSDSSMVDSVPISKIAPADVIGTIGKQQFLKARKAILRQQRIFSIQLFELHRLIKVQQSMATSPILLIENNLSFNPPSEKAGSEEISLDCVSDTKTGKEMNEETQMTVQQSANRMEPAVGELARPGIPSSPDWFHQAPGQTMNCNQNGNMYVGAFPPIPLMIPGGMSAWGFPHSGRGAAQCPVPVASPSGGFMYKSFPGIFPPTAAFSGPTFGTPGLLGVLPTVAGSQWSEHEHRYGLPASYLQWGSAVRSVPAFTPNYLPDWYGVPFPMVDPMHRAYAHGAPTVITHNGAAQEEDAPCCLESISKSISLEKASVLTPIPCSGAFLHQQLTNPLARHSACSDNARCGSHTNHSSIGLNTWSQSINLSNETSGKCGDPVRGKCPELSEAIGTNILQSGEYTTPERDFIDGSERTMPKQLWERDVDMSRGAYKCQMTLDDDTLSLFPLAPSLGGRGKPSTTREQQSSVIKVVPCNPGAAQELTAGILLSIQQERKNEANNPTVGM